MSPNESNTFCDDGIIGRYDIQDRANKIGFMTYERFDGTPDEVVSAGGVSVKPKKDVTFGFGNSNIQGGGQMLFGVVDDADVGIPVGVFFTDVE